MSTLRDFVNTWPPVVTATVRKHDAASVETVKVMLAQIATSGGIQLYDWARWMVWWHAYHEQQITWREKVIGELNQKIAKLEADLAICTATRRCDTDPTPAVGGETREGSPR